MSENICKNCGHDESKCTFDEVVRRAKELIKAKGVASAALLQRDLKISYAKSAEVLDILESNGEFDSEDAAIAKCREVVDSYLAEYKPKFEDAQELYESYTSYGDDPFIIGPTQVQFSAWDYAKEQCDALYKK